MIPSTLEPERVAKALTTAYEQTEAALKSRVKASVRLGFDRFVRVGSCAITAAVTESHYIVGNSGDCRAVLCRAGGKAEALSNVHNADEESERKRLRKERPKEKNVVTCALEGWLDPKSGDVYEKFKEGREFYEAGCYIKGVLQPTRAFGDFALKDKEMNVCFPTSFENQGQVNNSSNMNSNFEEALVEDAEFDSHGPYLTATPEILTIPRHHDDELLVLGSDGLFDYLQAAEICDIARSASSPELAAGALAEAVKLRALDENGISKAEYEALP